jgi:hypothetical protein
MGSTFTKKNAQTGNGNIRTAAAPSRKTMPRLKKSADFSLLESPLKNTFHESTWCTQCKPKKEKKEREKC